MECGWLRECGGVVGGQDGTRWQLTLVHEESPLKHSNTQWFEILIKGEKKVIKYFKPNTCLKSIKTFCECN